MIRDLPVDQLHLRDDARAINPDTVSGLVESIAAIGLINPLRVRLKGDGWEVIAGAHRLSAHKALGLVEVACDVVDDTDDLAEMAKIDENVFRLEPSPAERARDMARRKELYPHVHGNSSDGLNSLRFTAHVAKVTGLSEPEIVRQVSRGANILPELLERVAGTKLDTPGYLDALKLLPGSEQYEAVERDLAADRRAERVAASEEEHQFKTLMTAWRKASKAVRAEFLEKVRG